MRRVSPDVIRRPGGQRAKAKRALFSLPLVPLVDVLLAVVLFELSLFQAPDCACLRPQIQVPSAENVSQLEESPVIDLLADIAYLDGTPSADVGPALRAKRGKRARRRHQRP